MKISFLKIIFAFVFFLSPFVALAGSEHNMSGWAWSENIGWISFNSADDQNPSLADIQPAGSNYGVNKNANGTLTGYAWSSNIGWIKFGDLFAFPTGGGTVADNAKILSGRLVGWARACAGTTLGDCTTMASRTDGWDGWISLSGTTPPGTTPESYGVTLANDGKFDGYAWGSDVVGWISFGVSVPGVPGGPVCPGVCINPNSMSGTLTATAPLLSCNPVGDICSCTIVAGASSCSNINLTWTTTNPKVVGGSSVVSNTSDTGSTLATNVTIAPPITSGTIDSGTKSDVLVSGTNYGSRTFTLVNNSQNLRSTTIRSTCAANSGWSGTLNQCVAGLVNGVWITPSCPTVACGSPVSTVAYTCSTAPANCTLPSPTAVICPIIACPVAGSCGNGTVDPGEACDSGSTTGSATCTNLCQRKPGFKEN